MDTTTRQQTKDQIADLATRIKIGTMRNALTFPNLFTAEQAADLFLQAGITCYWLGGNQPVLTTAADFPVKNPSEDW